MANRLNLRDTADARGYEIVEPLAYAVLPNAPNSPAAPVTPTQPTPPIESARETHTAEVETPKKTGHGEKPRPREDWDDDGKEEPAWNENKKEFEPASKAEPADDAKVPGRDTRAIWIVHGMGQQVPFETLDSLTQGMMGAAQRHVPDHAGSKPRLRTVKLGEQTLQRVELDVKGKSGADYELHLYESYWAPKTEGVARLRDVVSFLWDGGTRGLLNSVKGFCRAMFGGMQTFQISWTTPFYICVTLLVLLALTLINGVMVVAAARNGLLSSTARMPGHWDQLAAIASCMTAVMFTFGTILFLGEMSKPGKAHRGLNAGLRAVTWAALGGTILAMVGAAALMGGIMRLDWINFEAGGGPNVSILRRLGNWVADIADNIPREDLQAFATVLIFACALLAMSAMVWRAILRSSEKKLPEDPVLLLFFFLSFALHLTSIAGTVWIWRSDVAPLPGVMVSWLGNSFWVWPFLIALSAKVRSVMIQYVGDVAIYVQSNKLDRFDEVRSKIKEGAKQVLSAMFLARAPGVEAFLYQNVAMVGHSLGSVIAYDTLNRLMLEDWLAAGQWKIAKRANSLVTFGSPLDKTAFFFTIQGTDELRVRERLAATVQPLIQSYYKFRTLRWINVYSGNDIISGRLTFYDLEKLQYPAEVPPLAVHNVVDQDAVVPLVAHVDYWKNETVWDELFQQIAP
ncbi:MAG: hypothetical protein NVS9B4_09900 [Candidatus Acidiferrum sp.]